VAAALMPLVPLLGWQAIFVIGGIPPLLIAPLIWRHMPHTARRAAAAPAQPISALFAQGRAVTTLALWCSISAVLLLLYLYLNWLPTIAVDRGFSANFGAGVGAAFNLGSSRARWGWGG
jgi:AAHS family 3-hydroxyphenylpropionic acid transporter